MLRLLGPCGQRLALQRTIRDPTFWSPAFTFGSNNQSSYFGTSFVFRTYQLDAAENALETRGLLNDPFKEHQDEGAGTATQAQVAQLESQLLKQIGEIAAKKIRDDYEADTKGR